MRVGCGTLPFASTRPRSPGIEKPCTSASTRPTRESAAGERDGEVRGHRGFADAALAAGHGDHPGERIRSERHLARCAAAAQALGQRAPLGGRHDAHLERDIRHAGDGCRRRAHIRRDALCCRAPDDREHDADGRDAVGHRDVAHHVELGDRSAQLRVDDRPDRTPDRVLRGDGHRAAASVGSGPVGRPLSARRAARGAP